MSDTPIEQIGKSDMKFTSTKEVHIMSTFFAKLTAFFMAILAFFGLIKPVDTSNLDLKDGYQVTVEKKDVTVFLESNPSTGYAWSYAKEGTNIVYVSQQYVQGTSGLLGAGGVDCFKFKAAAPGVTRLDFLYTKSGGLAVAKKVTVTVTVDSKMQVTFAAAVQESVPLDEPLNDKAEIIQYYENAYNKIGQQAKRVTLKYNYIENYKGISSSNGNPEIQSILESIIDSIFGEIGKPEDMDVAELPPLGGKNLSISPENVASATMTDKGNVFEITLVSTGTEENPEIDVLPGEGSVGCLGIVATAEDFTKDNNNMMTFSGVHSLYYTATLKATVDKATGNIVGLRFETPSLTTIEKISVANLSPISDFRIGILTIQEWTVSY